MKFEFYVLNYDHNFQNIHVQEYTEKAVKKYLRSPKNFIYKPFTKDEDVIYGFDALVREIDSILHGKKEADLNTNVVVDMHTKQIATS